MNDVICLADRRRSSPVLLPQGEKKPIRARSASGAAFIAGDLDSAVDLINLALEMAPVCGVILQPHIQQRLREAQSVLETVSALILIDTFNEEEAK